MFLHTLDTVTATVFGGILLRRDGLFPVLCTETEHIRIVVVEDLELRVRLFFHRLHGVILHRHVAGVLFQRTDGTLDTVQRGIRRRIGNRREVGGKQFKAEGLTVRINHESAGARRLFFLRDFLIIRVQDRGILRVREGLIVHVGIFFQTDDAFGGLNADRGILHVILHADDTVLTALFRGVDLRGNGHFTVPGAEAEEVILTIAEHLELRVRVFDLFLHGVILHGDAVCVLHNGAD